jgi:exopolysaccharide biosynthesis operon protein EpsL
MTKILQFIVVSTLGAVGFGAWAQSQDIVKLRSNLSILNNDNFFSATSGRELSERVTAQTIGANVALPYSLQRFELDASLTGNQYQTYTNFDYVGQNYSAAWLWSITSQLHGNLSTVRAETLNAAIDSLNPTLRNKNTTQNTALSANYDLGGPWQLTAGVANTNTINERAVIGSSDNRSTGVNAGVRYALASGNSLAYSMQVANGSSTNDYTSTTHDVTLVWVLSGNTSLNGRLAHLQQRFTVAPQFDFNGVAGALAVVWRPTGKTTLTAGWQRDLASYQTLGTTHTQTDTMTIGPAWQISPKTSLRMQYRYAVRDDQGNPTGAPTSRQDRLQDTSLTFGWQPRPLATLSVTVGEAGRSSNVANTDFSARTVSLAAVFSF